MQSKKIKVLVCDDSRLVRKQLRELLEDLGCDVSEAANGQECVEVCKQHQPNIAFMDIVMPIADGIEALRLIKDNKLNVKVVMLSSSGTATNLKEAIKLGADDFIQKPYNKEQIQKIISTLSC